jgi:hypothetical protein
MINGITYYCDDKRHLVCWPYNIENLHLMASDLGIKRCWFHKDHYDIPKKRIREIESKCISINSYLVIKIIGRNTDFTNKIINKKYPKWIVH